MTERVPVIVGWESFSEDEAVDAAIAEFGRDPTTSVAYCALAGATWPNIASGSTSF